MTTEIKNTSEDVDMAEREGENVVTMMDVLKEQEDFEEDANAVLGGSDDKNCTYSKGYIKRQALYACLTCCVEAKSDPEKRAGVCLACSLSCHENHELIELYTKRNFRCDCGNPKFNSHPCTFTPNKTDLNEDNIYNQNFSGLYCTCKRPYPDPESTEEDEMIQCIVCEDWLHASHLETTTDVKNIQYSEMICKNCMDKNEFLHDYSELAVNTDIKIDVVNGTENSNSVINGDAKNDEISNISDMKHNDTATNLEVEMSEENIKVSTGNTNEEKDETVSKTSELTDKEEETISETKEKDMETETGEKEEDTTKSENESTVNATNNIEESTDMKQSDQIETKQEEVASEQNDIEKSNENVAKLKETEVNPVESSDSKEEPLDAETKVSEADAEKMEEDRLLADPEDNVKPKDQEKENSIQTDSSDTAATKEENETTKPTTDIENSEASKSETSSEVNVESSEVKTTEEKPEEEIKEKSQEENITTTDDTTDTEIKSIAAETETNNVTHEKEGSQNDKKEENKPDDVEKISEKRKLSIEENVNDFEAKKLKLDDNNSGSCARPRGVKHVHKGATFWPSNFRQKLCTCSACITMYKDLAVLFLIDPEDTVTAYENLGKSIINGQPQTQYEKGLEALSSLDRVQQINALTEYNIMKDKLVDFLKSFRDRREIVKEEDIRAFFAGMKPKKQSDGVYFCR